MDAEAVGIAEVEDRADQAVTERGDHQGVVRGRLRNAGLPIGQRPGALINFSIGLFAGPYQWLIRRSDDPARQGECRIALPARTINAASDCGRMTSGQEIADL